MISFLFWIKLSPISASPKAKHQRWIFFLAIELRKCQNFLTFYPQKSAVIRFRFSSTSKNIVVLVTRNISLKCYLENGGLMVLPELSSRISVGLQLQWVAFPLAIFIFGNSLVPTLLVINHLLHISLPAKVGFSIITL